jgi:hypothetical protein
VVALEDSQLHEHSGYVIQGWQNPAAHPTLAQRLASDLLLYNEPPSVRRAVRERILAAQITARFGRAQVLEWYSTPDFGHYALAWKRRRSLLREAASQLNLTESALLVAAAQSPGLNPLDAPQAALQRGREIIHILEALELISAEDAARALTQAIAIQPAPADASGDGQANTAAFLNLALSQLDARISRTRLERGGLTVFTTLDLELQAGASCITTVYAARLHGEPDPDAECEAARLLPSLPPGITLTDSSSSALISIRPPDRCWPSWVKRPGTGNAADQRRSRVLLSPFIYHRFYAAESRRWSGIYRVGGCPNYDGVYHGPPRARTAPTLSCAAERTSSRWASTT